MELKSLNIGVIAGGGDLPKHVAFAASLEGHELYFVALQGFAQIDQYIDVYNDIQSYRVSEFGKIVKYFKKKNCTHICFAGIVKRPNFKTLKPDFKGVVYMPGAIKAAQKGDDALMRYLLSLFEKEGFEVLSPQSLCQSLLLPEGILGKVDIADKHRNDVRKACEIASKIGALDIGQAAIVNHGVVLTVEAQEGTDAMLDRVLTLPEEIRGSAQARSGVLAKMVKPGQETRVDLPTIGPRTVEKAAAAGLAGIVAEGGRAFLLEQDKVIQLADDKGLFIAGLPKSTT